MYWRILLWVSNGRICELLHKKYATDSESFRDFRLRFDTISMSFRPDIAILAETTRSYELWNDAHWQGYVSKSKNISIIELGYVREGFAAAKQVEKRAQHSLLKYLLQDLGWRVRYHTITLGVTGTVYNDSITCLRELKLSHSAQEQTVRSWVHMTLNHTHGLVTQRRQLDSHFINAAFKKPP